MPSHVTRIGGDVVAQLKATQTRLDTRMRELDRPSVGLALGSGAARGLAHIGVLKSLLANAVPIDIITGCSMGAVIGGCFAAGVEPAELEEIARSINRREVFRQIDLVVPSRGGLISGARVSELLRELTSGKSFDELRFPFACTAADVLTGEEVVLEDGLVSDAIRCSSSIPGVFQPVVVGHRVLVDGGILNPIPANYLVAMGVDVVIAVDVMPVLAPSESQLGKAPSIIATLINSFDIMGRIVSEPTQDIASVVISPQVGKVFGAEFWRGSELIEEGWKAAEAAIPHIMGAIRSHDGQSPIR